MSSFINSERKMLPAVPLRDMVVFPHMMAPFIVGRESSVRALEVALSQPEKQLFLITQRDPKINDPQRQDIQDIGVVARVIKNLKQPTGNVKVMVEGERRARLYELIEHDGALSAEVDMLDIRYPNSEKLQAYMSKVLSTFEQYAKMSHHLAFEGLMSILKLDDPDRLADTLAAHLMVSTADKQTLLDMLNPYERLRRLHDLIDVEIEKVNIDKRVNVLVKKQMERVQKEYYLNEKVKAIEEHLAGGDWAGKEKEEEKEYLELKIKVIKEELAELGRQDKAPSILRSIEFPPEYHEAGVSILSYFATVLREKYADIEVAVTITQDGHRVTMAIETPEGQREEIEGALNDFGLVVRGEMDAKEFLDDPIQVLDLKNELRIMHARLESKDQLMATKDQLMATKDQLIKHQEVTLERLGQLLSQALEPQPVPQLPPIHIHHNSPLHVAVDAKGGDATIQHAFYLEQQLPDLNAHLQEAAKNLPAEEGRQLLDAAAALGQLDEGADKGQVKAVLTRIAQAFQDAGDDKSKLSKALKGARRACKALQAAGRAYNSIAQWCGAPVVPEVLLRTGETGREQPPEPKL